MKRGCDSGVKFSVKKKKVIENKLDFLFYLLNILLITLNLTWLLTFDFLNFTWLLTKSQVNQSKVAKNVINRKIKLSNVKKEKEKLINGIQEKIPFP